MQNNIMKKGLGLVTMILVIVALMIFIGLISNLLIPSAKTLIGIRIKEPNQTAATPLKAVSGPIGDRPFTRAEAVDYFVSRGNLDDRNICTALRNDITASGRMKKAFRGYTEDDINDLMAEALVRYANSPECSSSCAWTIGGYLGSVDEINQFKKSVGVYGSIYHAFDLSSCG